VPTLSPNVAAEAGTAAFIVTALLAAANYPGAVAAVRLARAAAIAAPALRSPRAALHAAAGLLLHIGLLGLLVAHLPILTNLAGYTSYAWAWSLRPLLRASALLIAASSVTLLALRLADGLESLRAAWCEALLDALLLAAAVSGLASA
jgi:hypothetical protein